MVSRLGFDALSALALALTALLGAYTPAYLARRDRLAGGTGRSLVYVLGNMLSAGGCWRLLGARRSRRDAGDRRAGEGGGGAGALRPCHAPLLLPCCCPPA
jgi:hypothetical protein